MRLPTYDFHSSARIQPGMPDQEKLLTRTASLLQASQQLLLKFEIGRDRDCRCLEKSAMAINESQFLISETDKAILNPGLARALRNSN